MGRPEKRPEDRRGKTPTVRMTTAEYRLVEQAAKSKGMKVTHWMRDVLLRAARRTKTGGK